MNRLTRYGIVVVAIVPVLLAAVAYLAVERQSYVGASTVLKITENAGAVSAEEVFAAVSDVAERRRFDVAREVVDLRSPETKRHLFLALGQRDGPRAGWLEDGYPDLTELVSTAVAPLSTIGPTDPRGYYYVFGTIDQARALELRLGDLGLTGTLLPQPSAITDLFVLLPAPTVALLGTTALGIVALGSAGAVSRHRERAVVRLHGGGVGSVLARDLRGARAWLLSFPAAWVGVGLPYAAGGSPQAEVLIPMAGMFTVAAVALLVIGHVGTTVLGCSETIVTSLSNRRPPRWSARAIGAVRLPALILVASSLSVAVAASAQLHGFRTSELTREAAGSAVTVGISGSLGESELRDGPGSVWERFGSWAQRAERGGELVLTAAFGLRELGSWSGPDVPVVFVNDRYLQEQGINGVRAPTEGVRFVVPERSPLRESEVGPALIDGAALKLRVGQAETSIERASMPRRLFTYATPGRVAPTWVDDPVLVVVSSAVLQRAENRVDLASWISTGDIVIADDRWARASIEADELTTAVLSVQLVAQAAADAERRLAEEAAIGWSAAITALVIAALVAATSVTARVQRDRRRVSVQHAHGWSFLRSRRGAVLVESALVGFVCLVAWYERASLAPDVEGLNLELDPVVAHATSAFLVTVTCACALGGAAIASEWLAHRRITATIREELS